MSNISGAMEKDMAEFNRHRSSKELDVLIGRVNALIPSSVTPDTRIEIHPCDWLTLADAARASNEPPVDQDDDARAKEIIENLRDALRYRRLRILGCAPANSEHLGHGLVMRFTNLDGFVDDDIRIHPERGDSPTPPPDPEREIPMGSRVRGILATHIAGTVVAIDTRYEIQGDNGEYWTAWHRELEVTSPTKEVTP